MIDRFLGETESYREKYCLIVLVFCFVFLKKGFVRREAQFEDGEETAVWKKNIQRATLNFTVYFALQVQSAVCLICKEFKVAEWMCSKKVSDLLYVRIKARLFKCLKTRKYKDQYVFGNFRWLLACDHYVVKSSMSWKIWCHKTGMLNIMLQR